MEYRIENGKGFITIGSVGIGCYFKFKKPVAVVWADCHGSIGEYVSLLPVSDEDKSLIQNSIHNSLEEDYSHRLEELYQLLLPLFQLFQNGKYQLNFWNNQKNEFFRSTYIKDGVEHQDYDPLVIIFSEIAYIDQQEEKIKQYHAYMNSNKEYHQLGNSTKYRPDILEFTTTGIYSDQPTFIATKPKSSINEKRVRYYEEIIRSGRKPFAILFSQHFDDEDIPYFILDGHHKLLAYQRLNISPPLCFITYIPEKVDEIEMNLESITGLLYPWQSKHILWHLSDREKYLIPLLNNPDSSLHKVIKSGFVKEFHWNGQLKSQGFYILDRPEGELKEWYENGNLKFEQHYFQRKPVGIWKHYFPSGKLESVKSFNKQNELSGDVKTYFESGQIRFISQYYNGKLKDGISTRSFHETGDKYEEYTYKNGKLIEKKMWNEYKELYIHEKFNEASQKLEKVAIPESESFNLNERAMKWSERKAEIQRKKDLDNLDAEFYFKISVIILIILVFIFGTLRHIFFK